MVSRCFDDIDDQKATRIGQNLAAAATTSSTRIKLSISSQLTVRGARALAHGLKHIAQIELLDICCVAGISEQTGNALQPILEVAIQQCQELLLNFHLNDGVAEELSALLLLLPMDNDQANNHHALQTLHLFIGRNMTLDGAQRLANSLRHAKLKCLELSVDIHWDPLDLMPTIYLAVLDSVEKLVILNSMSDAAAVLLGDALIGNTKLHSLQLDFLSSWSHLSIDAFARLADGISQSCIVRLDISRRMPADAEDVLYVMGVARSSTIQHLSVGDGCHGTSGLARCIPRLHTLNLQHCEVKDVPALMAGLRNASHLSSLVLGQLFEEEHDILTLCDALPHMTSLTDLTICCQLAFTQAGDTALLDFESRHIQATSTEQLMVAVAISHPSLVRLTLNDSWDIGHAGLAMIGMHLPHVKLKELSLGLCNEYAPDERKSVERAFQRACQALVAGVRSNWHLRVLTLSEEGVRLPSKVAEEVDFYLDLN